MSDYSKRDNKNYGDMDIAKTALVTFREKLDICRDIFYKCDRSKFINGTNMERSDAIDAGASYILNPSQGEDKECFIREGLMMRQSLSLCRSLANYEERMDAAYFDAIRTIIVRLRDKKTIITQRD